LLFTSSVEGGFCNGLNVLKGKVVKLPEIVKVPHMGWNSLRIVRENPLLDGLPDRSYVYFAHSYYASAEDSSIVAATTSYGVEFPSVIFSKYVYGTQFHPEKSGEVGQIIIKNFVDLARR
jgi:glutamine amidotransferase